MKRFLVVAAALATAGCTHPVEKTKELVEMHGLTFVSKDGFAFFGCSDEDEVQTKFTAKTKEGREVHGVICSGFGPFAKGATVRFQ